VLVYLKEVTKRVDGEEILKGVSLGIEQGEFVSVVGASGSGKSSLLYIMGLLDRPTEGEVYFEGRRIDYSRGEELSHLRNSKIGFIFQFHYLLPEFSALENVMIPMLKAGISRREAEERSVELLRSVGLSGKESRRPYQLSGGEQQRVAIARALANDPAIILADEPTGNLDSKNTEVVMEIFEKLNSEGRTIVMVTHESHLAARTRRTVEMRDGRLLS